jgi:hypothetical protein
MGVNLSRELRGIDCVELMVRSEDEAGEVLFLG